MTDEDRVLQAIGRAQDVLAAYFTPGPRDERKTISDLLVIMDDHDLVSAHERLTWKTKTHSGVKPGEAQRRYCDARKHIENREDTPNGK